MNYLFISYFLLGIICLFSPCPTPAFAQPTPSLLDVPLLPPGHEEALFLQAKVLLREPTRTSAFHDARLKRAVSFILLHEDSAALAELQPLQEAKASSPPGAQACFLSGVARFHLEDYLGALSEFQSSLTLDSSWSPHTVFFGKGSALYALGRYPEALGCFARIYPESIRTSEEGEVAYLTGASLLALKRHEEAAQAFRLYLSKTRNPSLLPEANFFLGLSEYSLGNLDQASQAFRRAILAHPRFFLRKDASDKLGAHPGSLPPQPVPLHFDTLGGQHQYTDESLFLLSLCAYKGKRYVEAESLVTYLEAYFPGSGYSAQGKLLYAIALFDQKNWDKAEPALLLLVQGPDGAEALFHLGLLYAENGHPLWASRAFERVREEDSNGPYAPQSLYRLGEMAYERKDFAYAEHLFEQLIMDYPGNELADDAQLGLGWSAYRQKRFREASQAFDAYGEANPSAPGAQEAVFRSGVSAFLAGEEESAILALRKYATMGSGVKSDSALLVIAQSYERLKRPAKAVEAYREFLSTFLDHALSAESYLALGKALLELSDFRAARDAFGEAERRARSSLLQEEARYQGELAKAGRRGQMNPLSVAQSFLARYPDSPRSPKLLLDIAQYQQALHKRELALVTLDKLAESYPASPEALRAHLLRARIYEDMKEPSSAVDEYEAVILRRDPDYSPQALIGLAKVYQGLKQYELARDQLRRLLMDYWDADETSPALIEIGHSFYREGWYAEAMTAYQQAETRTKGRYRLEAQLGQANCLLEEALYAKAVGTFLRLSHEQDIPKDLLVQSLYGQGAAQSALGDTTRALDAFTRALDLASDPQTKAQLQRQIDLLAQRGQE